MEESKRSMPAYRWLTITGGAFLVLLYAALVIASGFVGLLPWPKMPPAVRQLANPIDTAEPVTTPHIMVYPPADPKITRSDDFSAGLDGWDLYYANGKMQDIKGQLALESNAEGTVAIAINEEFLLPGDRYYVQADFVQEGSSGTSYYGLVFGASQRDRTFYVLQAMPRLSLCQLLRYTNGRWATLVNMMRAGMRPYPRANTLSVYFDDGRMEFYVNGELISVYTESEPLRNSGVGALQAGSRSRLRVDNLFGYTQK